MADPGQLFLIQREIIGCCPLCHEFFRLSDSKILIRGERGDLLDDMKRARRRLSVAEERLNERESELRESARLQGRNKAKRLVRKMDPIFAPMGLSAEDASPLYHPVDYAVFHRLSETDQVQAIHLLDHRAKARQDRGLQRSVERCVEQGKVEWLTLRVTDAAEVIRE